VPGVGGGTFGFASTYGETGTLESRSFPGDLLGGLGETVSYDYFSRNGRPFSVTSSLGGYQYVRQTGWHASGALRFTDRGPAGSGSTALYDIDFVTNRLTRRWDYETLGAATGLQYTEYEYDLNGNIDQMKRHAWEAECYSYDHLDRLVDAFTSTNNCGSLSVGFDRDYVYDSVGNLTFKSGPGVLTYSGAANAGPFGVTSTAAGDSFGYDLNANMVSRNVVGEAGQTLSYDVQQRLVSLTGGPVAEFYDYGSDGVRVVSDDGVETTVSLGGVYERTVNNVTGSQVEEILYYSGPGGMVAMRVNGVVQHLFSDHLGGVVAVWEPAIDASSVQTYFPYGEVRQGGGFDTVLGFTGQRVDSGTGLMYYNARYYDPYLGRFTQPDTIVPDYTQPQDLNRYAYVLNNPVRYNDPTGRDYCEGGGGGCGTTREGDTNGDGFVAEADPLGVCIEFCQGEAEFLTLTKKKEHFDSFLFRDSSKNRLQPEPLFPDCSTSCVLLTGGVALVGFSLTATACPAGTVATGGLGAAAACGGLYALTTSATKAVYEGTSDGDFSKEAVFCSMTLGAVTGGLPVATGLQSKVNSGAGSVVRAVSC